MPVLKSGITLANFSFLGKLPVFIIQLNILLIGLDIVSWIYFKVLIPILFTVLQVSLISHTIFDTSDAVQFFK